MKAAGALLLFLLLAGATGDDPVDRLLARARMTHEPSAVIREAVALLDARLDADAGDKRAWMRLGEALAIGIASSRHAASPLAAWRRGHEIDPRDCHAAALVARAELRAGPSQVLDQWRARPEACAEIFYLAARLDPRQEIALLERSRAGAPSAEALVALGAAHLRRANLRAAEAAYAAALQAPFLFPEDWRVDGWTAVHANLGLAVIYTETHRWARARAARKALHETLGDPGPWHDLSDEEKRWARRVLHEELE